MFDEVYLGLPLWVWLVIVGMIAYNCYLTTANCKERFDDNDSGLKVYNFNTSWCGYSVRFQPIWDKFSSANKSDAITIVDVKCDDEKNEKLCKSAKYGVQGFPTVLAEKNGKVQHYEVQRTQEGLEAWVNKL
jgi:thiol-disulfide isomerase/thioredoxin